MIPHYPGRAPVDAYGNGGFRFAGMSHQGAILVLPTGILAWDPHKPLIVQDFSPVLDATTPVEFLLLGTGLEIERPPKTIRDAFAAKGIGLEPMSTGAAVRTYNILLAEQRHVGAALMAVDHVR